MKPNLLILLIVIVAANAFSKFDPVWQNDNGQIGSLFFEENSGIAISEQNIEIEFFEKENQVYCRFKIAYHLTSTSVMSESKKVRGMFYNKTSQNIQMYQNDKPVSQEIPTEIKNQIDFQYHESSYEYYVSKIEVKKKILEEEYKSVKKEPQPDTSSFLSLYDIAATSYVDTQDRSKQYALEKLERNYKLYIPPIALVIKGNPFEITYSPNDLNVLVVTGVLKPNPLGSHLRTPVENRHFIFNAFILKEFDTGLISFLNYLSFQQQMEYLERITYSVTIPETWNISSSIFSADARSNVLVNSGRRGQYLDWDKDLYHIKTNCPEGTKPTVQHTNNTISFSGTLCGNSLPPALRFSVQNRPRFDFNIGGPKIGFGKNHRSENFAMRLGWESALEFGDFNLMMALEYESDFRDENTIAFSLYPMTPSVYISPVFGVGVGLPYDINNKQLGLRLRYEVSGMLLGISGNYDYFPESNEWRFSLFGEVSL